MSFLKKIIGFVLGAAAGWIFIKAAMPSFCPPFLASFMGCLNPFSSLNLVIVLLFGVIGWLVAGRL